MPVEGITAPPAVMSTSCEWRVNLKFQKALIAGTPGTDHIRTEAGAKDGSGQIDQRAPDVTRRIAAALDLITEYESGRQRLTSEGCSHA
jgi:hypothetical protein